MKLLAFFLSSLLPLAGALAQWPPTPDQLYGPLFHDVQMQRVFPDGKTFVDCTPKRPVKDILQDYEKAKGPGLNLRKFVEDNFHVPAAPQSGYESREQDVVKHIQTLWSVLRRQPDTAREGSSLLPLPNAYIVPGGRFREIYYWDSYFTMLGLKESGEEQIIEQMVANFSYLIITYGHIPNGNRSYYLSRSQPPFFALMVELLASLHGPRVYGRYLPALQKEYDYWMRGAEDITPGQAKYAVVKMPDGGLLNRYWDDSDQPRQESYREDVLTADTFAMEKMATMRFRDESAQKAMDRQLHAEAWQHLRAGAASGWDFSTRWFADGKNIHTIQTTHIIPVDLNALLCRLETVLARAYQQTGNQAKSTGFLKKASKRAELINEYCWNKSIGYYTDYHWVNQEPLKMITPAGFYPFTLLPAEFLQGKIQPAVVQLRQHLLKPGGIVTTAQHSHQQWDAPNGWAPLQWMVIRGLEQQGENSLAKDIAQRWVKLNVDVFRRTRKLMEKYNVENTALEAGGGEYPSQDGFGWTNGVLLALIKKYNLPH
jgi:alpha,alpha-trehalase